MSLAELGRFTEAAAYAFEAMELAKPTHHAYSIGLGHFAICSLHVLKGDWVKARSAVDEWLEAIQAGKIFRLLPIAVASAALVLARTGEVSTALSRLQEGEQLVERAVALGFVGAAGWLYHRLGQTCVALGRLGQGRHLAERAIEFSASHPGFAANGQHLLGEITTHPDRFDAESAEAHYRNALGLAEPRSMRPLIAHCHLGLGKLYRRTEKREQAHEHLTTATTMYCDMDMRFWLEQAEAEMKGLD